MKIPRDLNGQRLVKALRKLGYEIDRQNGSHIRITTERDGKNHEVVPNHHPIKPGTLSSILKHVAAHHVMSVEELLETIAL
jgi:predicted RNA binding protein YcfA (HicA-like mRNA interferase family)